MDNQFVQTVNELKPTLTIDENGYCLTSDVNGQSIMGLGFLIETALANLVHVHRMKEHVKQS